MSSKINIKSIVMEHFSTLCNADESWSWWDVFTFIFLPILFASIAIATGFNLNKDLVSLLVNFGAIFTALLLSVLVLVYDQETKIDTKKTDSELAARPSDIFFRTKKKLLHQLYCNISFSIICSLLLITFSFAHSIFDSFNSDPKNASQIATILTKLILTPLAIMTTTNLLLTITMIVKRLHAFLTMKD